MSLVRVSVRRVLRSSPRRRRTKKASLDVPTSHRKSQTASCPSSPQLSPRPRHFQWLTKPGSTPARGELKSVWSSRERFESMHVD
eukprot:1320319-Amorphochlora_amoeboformis.AAC.1